MIPASTSRTCLLLVPLLLAMPVLAQESAEPDVVGVPEQRLPDRQLPAASQAQPAVLPQASPAPGADSNGSDLATMPYDASTPGICPVVSDLLRDFCAQYPADGSCLAP
jgi:hypothetical protein